MMLCILGLSYRGDLLSCVSLLSDIRYVDAILTTVCLKKFGIWILVTTLQSSIHPSDQNKVLAHPVSEGMVSNRGGTA